MDVTELPPAEWSENRGHNIWGKSSERASICAPKVTRPSHQEPGEKPWYHPWPDLRFDTYIRNVAKISFHHLRNIAKVNAETLMQAFITSGLDYCNALLSALAKKNNRPFTICSKSSCPSSDEDQTENTYNTYFKVPAMTTDFKILY